MNDLTRIFKALGDESRLRILRLLFVSGELCVCDIQDATRFTQTKVSRHLGYLKEAGLVDDRKQGNWMLYSLSEPKDEVRRTLLASLRNIIGGSDIGKDDEMRLIKNIKKGCCTTSTVIKPAKFLIATNS